MVDSVGFIPTSIDADCGEIERAPGSAATAAATSLTSAIEFDLEGEHQRISAPLHFVEHERERETDDESRRIAARRPQQLRLIKADVRTGAFRGEHSQEFGLPGLPRAVDDHCSG